MSRKLVSQILYEVKDSLELFNKEAYGERSLDIMVSDTYLIQNINDSLEEIQGYINKQYEEYFLTYSTYKFNSETSQQKEYSLPDNIYMNKIRRVVYHKGNNPLADTEKYLMRRVQNINEVHNMSEGNYYKYMLIDMPVTGEAVDYRTKVVILPYSNSNDDYFTIWYIREMATVSATGDTVDVPFMRYLVEDVKYKCLEKDIGNPMADNIAMKRKELYDLMEISIANRIPDDQSGYMQPDVSHYEDSLLNDDYDY